MDKLIEEKKDKPLTFFGVSSQADRRDRNELCLDLIRLAKKGNLSAEKTLMGYLEILVADWIDRDSSLDVYKIYKDDLEERIRRCIYLYREKGAAGFVGYLYINLREQAKGLNQGGQRKISLDDPFGSGLSKDKRERHELIDTDSILA